MVNSSSRDLVKKQTFLTETKNNIDNLSGKAFSNGNLNSLDDINEHSKENKSKPEDDPYKE
jgi:hypothetical protein